MYIIHSFDIHYAFLSISLLALTLLNEWQKWHPACKNLAPAIPTDSSVGDPWERDLTWKRRQLNKDWKRHQ